MGFSICTTYCHFYNETSKLCIFPNDSSCDHFEYTQLGYVCVATVCQNNLYIADDVSYCLESCPSNAPYTQNGMCVTQCQAGQTLVGTFCQVVANKSTPVYVIGLIIAIAIIVAALMAICIAIKRSKVKKQKAKKT